MVVAVVAAIRNPSHLSVPPCQCVSGWREDFSEAVRRWLLAEITASNPSFPTQRIFAQLLKRRTEHLLKPSAPGELTPLDLCILLAAEFFFFPLTYCNSGFSPKGGSKTAFSVQSYQLYIYCIAIKCLKPF